MTPATAHLSRPLRRLLAIGAAALLPAAASHGADSPSVMVTIPELRALGIAIDLSQVEPARRPRVPAEAGQPFPNRCFGLVSVSDELLRQMQAQGFSLATLCIGLDSPHVAFHPETGAPLTSVRVRYRLTKEDEADDILELLIQVPKCFARGNPYGDCKMRHDWMGGIKHDKDQIDYFARSSRQIAELMKLLGAKGVFQRECGCGDFQAPQPDSDIGPEFRQGAICRASQVPRCPRPISRKAYPGSLQYDLESWRLGGDDLLRKRLGLAEGASQADWGLLNEVFEVSPDLPLGYAYRVMTPEGETAKAMVKQQAGRILSVGTK